MTSAGYRFGLELNKLTVTVTVVNPAQDLGWVRQARDLGCQWVTPAQDLGWVRPAQDLGCPGSVRLTTWAGPVRLKTLAGPDGQASSRLRLGQASLRLRLGQTGTRLCRAATVGGDFKGSPRRFGLEVK